MDCSDVIVFLPLTHQPDIVSWFGYASGLNSLQPQSTGKPKIGLDGLDDDDDGNVNLPTGQ